MAQAMAAEVAARHRAAAAVAEHHGQPASDQRRSLFSNAQDALFNMTAIEKEALAVFLQTPGRDQELCSYMADPSLCALCLSPCDPQAACCLACGRWLCSECRAEDNMCSNVSRCAQPHPTAGNAAIRALPSGSEIVARWHNVSNHGALSTKNVGRGRRQADQTPEHPNQLAAGGHTCKLPIVSQFDPPRSAGHQKEAHQIAFDTVYAAIDHWARQHSGAFAGLPAI